MLENTTTVVNNHKKVIQGRHSKHAMTVPFHVLFFKYHRGISYYINYAVENRR